MTGGYFDLNLVGNTVIHFTATSLTISAIPEPSTYAAVAGAMMLGVALWRRRERIS